MNHSISRHSIKGLKMENQIQDKNIIQMAKENNCDFKVLLEERVLKCEILNIMRINPFKGNNKNVNLNLFFSYFSDEVVKEIEDIYTEEHFVGFNFFNDNHCINGIEMNPELTFAKNFEFLFIESEKDKNKLVEIKSLVQNNQTTCELLTKDAVKKIYSVQGDDKDFTLEDMLNADDWILKNLYYTPKAIQNNKSVFLKDSYNLIGEKPVMKISVSWCEKDTKAINNNLVNVVKYFKEVKVENGSFTFTLLDDFEYPFENEHDVFVGVNYSKEKMYNFLT